MVASKERRAKIGTQLKMTPELFRVSPKRENAPALCFIAFSSREPVSTSLENALDTTTGSSGAFLWRKGAVSEIAPYREAAGEKARRYSTTSEPAA